VNGRCDSSRAYRGSTIVSPKDGSPCKIVCLSLALAIGLLAPQSARSRPPLCQDLSPQPSDADIDSAARQALSEVSTAEQMKDWGLAARRAGQLLGCILEDGNVMFASGFETGDTTAWTASLSSTTGSASTEGAKPTRTSAKSLVRTSNCQESYCSPYDPEGGVWYCGRGDTQTNPTSFHGKNTSELLNQTCWEHDKCYRRRCILDNCFFDGPDHQSAECDARMLSICDSVTALVDRIVCSIARNLPWAADPLLDRSSCTSSSCGEGQSCIISGNASACGVPSRWLLCFVGPGSCSIAISSSYQCPICSGQGGCLGPCAPGNPGWSDGILGCGLTGGPGSPPC